jgi:uncharacterized protein
MNIIANTISQASEKIFSNVLYVPRDLPKITSFLIKVTARCNLNCDYCYVFNHADQSWKKMPAVLSSENRKLFAKRLTDYATEVNLDQCLILFHGGEPLLVGVERILEIVSLIKKEMPSEIKLYFSMQTNGTLLTKEKIEALEKENIGISLSLDGPKEVNDIHRLSHQKNSSFPKVMNAYKLLKEYPKTFTGVIGVIDPTTSPKEVLSFFAELDPPQIDLLLPDANYLNPPPLRDKNVNIYVDWLIEAFNIWYDEYPDLKMRLFEGLLGAIAGLPSQTDAFGLGDLSLLTIETDGFYHDLDVLKITKEGFSSLGLHLEEASITEALSTHKIANHRRLLTFEGLSDKCQSCPEVQICGGGSVPHRYNHNGFNNPTIYCREMLSLISHARRRLIESISINSNQKSTVLPEPGFEDFDVLSYERTANKNIELQKVYNEWGKKSYDRFIKILDYTIILDPDLKKTQEKILSLPETDIRNLSVRPSTLLWMKVLEQHQLGLKLYDIEGKVISPDPKYLNNIYKYHNQQGFEIHKEDYWLRCPFGNSITFEKGDTVHEGEKIVTESLKIIEEFDPAIKDEMKLISPYIQFVRDPSAHPDKVVSFSDNIVPGALYVSICKGNKGFIDPYDLADSLIHEHRHQKLYLLEQFVPVIISDTPLISSPWRKELRPVSGVFHGVFVFHQLKQYWQFLYHNREGDLKKKAEHQKIFSGDSMAEGIKTLETSPITPAGRKILNEFEKINEIYF